MVEKQRDRNTTDTRGVRLEGSSVSERHSGDGLQSLRPERDSGQGAEGGDGPQRGSGQQCVHQGNAGKQAWDPLGNSEYKPEFFHSWFHKLF